MTYYKILATYYGVAQCYSDKKKAMTKAREIGRKMQAEWSGEPIRVSVVEEHPEKRILVKEYNY